MSQLIEIKHLRDFSKCSAYAKYNWNAADDPRQSVNRSIIESCYRDAAVLEKRTNWKTIRSRIYRMIFDSETNKSPTTLYKESLVSLNTMRDWYLEHYRDEPGEAICNLELQDEISGVLVTAKIDTVLVSDSTVTLIEFRNDKEILKDIGLRAKIYLLGKEHIRVNRVLVINVTDKTVTCTKLAIHNPDEWNYKTYQVLQLMMLSIKQGIFYPSPTSMCASCPYKMICSW